jgi:hypothetical protein
MRVYEPPATTSAETIRRYGELADRGGPAEAAARAWTEAGFDDEQAAKWLAARCFDPLAARELSDLGVKPEQARARTRDGGGDYVDTIAFKVADGQLTARQGAARCMSSR